jgi:hypothetical protein
MLKGKGCAADDFDGPLADDFLEQFEGRNGPIPKARNAAES